MGTKLTEFHGAKPLSPESKSMASRRWCPFIDQKCKKKQSGGGCSLQAQGSEPVIICPNRLYAENFKVIRDIACECFGENVEMITDKIAEKRRRAGDLTGNEVVVFGQGFSGEVGIKAPSGDADAEGSFKIDFLLVKVDAFLDPISIVAIEVQTIDTTDSYKPASTSYYDEKPFLGKFGPDVTPAGFNWENVSKRILPQLIYKGHALRREKNANFGLFFVLPHAVLEKIKVRVGGELLDYPKGPGTITLKSYKLGAEVEEGFRSLDLVESFTTTVEQIAFAFVSPKNLPPLGVYQDTLKNRLAELSRKRKLD